MATIQVRNRLRHTEPIAGVTVMLIAPGLVAPLTAVTGAGGAATLTTTGLATGTHTLTITPQHLWLAAVGPSLAPPGAIARVFRQLTVQVTIGAGGAITAATVPAAQAQNGTAAVAGAQLTVQLQPVFMRSPHNGSRTMDVTGIIIHHTGGPTIGGAIEEFLGGGAHTSAHYVIDTDGQIIKMVLDSRTANHAGVASWDGQTNVNGRTIGIEIVNSTGRYPEPQYTALLSLLRALQTAFPTLILWNVVAHSDIATNDAGRLGRKSGDPGGQFEWSRVERLGLGMAVGAGPLAPTSYGGFFVAFAGQSLRLGDNDTAHRFGGAVRASITAGVVRELQTDLRRIGYAVGTPDGDFGGKTDAAVKMFQEHFFAGGRGHKAPDGRVDAETARQIKLTAAARP